VPGLSLSTVYSGWEGYQQSIVNAVRSLSPAQLAWRPAPGQRSAGEVVRHIALGRATWFLRMNPPGGAALQAAIGAQGADAWEVDADGNRYVREAVFAIDADAGALVRWLERTWAVVEATLREWTVADLSRAFAHTWNGDAYAIPYQWVIWRIMAHDIHHGGELALLLGLQGIEAFELAALGGHIILPPRAGGDGGPLAA
jgi:uncharacterized damage-inducible protein DinB